MHIHELSEAANLPIDTIRYYERRGLLGAGHFQRKSNGYRDYQGAAIVRLQLIRQAKAAGFTLTEIGDVIDAWDAEAINDQDKREMLGNKIEETESRIRDLNSVKAYLALKLRGTGSDSSVNRSADPVMVR